MNKIFTGVIMKVKKHNSKIRLKTFLVVVSTLMVVVLLTLLSILLYMSTVQEIQKKLESINNMRTNQILGSIEAEFAKYDKISRYIMNNKRLKDYIKALESGDEGSYESHLLSSKITNILFNAKEYIDTIKSINIISSKAQYNNGGSVVFNYPLLNYYYEARSSGIDLIYPSTPVTKSEISHISTPAMLKEHYYINFDLSENDEYYGNVFIIIDDLLRPKSYDGYNIIILDNQNNTIWEYNDSSEAFDIKLLANQQNIESGLYNEYSIYNRKILFGDLSVYLVMDNSAQNTHIKLLQTLIFVAFSFSLLVGVIFTKYISNKILLPVNKLVLMMRNYKEKVKKHSRKDEKSKLSLRESIFIYFVVSIIIPVILFTGIYYSQSNKIIKDHIIDSYAALFDKTVQDLDQYFLQKQEIVFRFVYDRNFQDFPSFYQNNENPTDLLRDIFEENKFLGLDRDTISIFDFTNNHLLISNRIDNQNFLDEDYYQYARSNFPGLIWNFERDEINRAIVSLGMPLGITYGRREQAFIKLYIDSVFLSRIFMDLKSDNLDSFLVDKDNRLLSYSGFAENVDMIPYYGINSMIKMEISNNDYLIFSQKIESVPFYFVLKYDYLELSRQSALIFTNNIYLFIILLLLIFILSYMTAYSILKPVNAINRHFIEFDPINSEDKYNHDYFIQDIDMLGNTFNQMTERIEKLIDELIVANIKRERLETEKKTAEIESLQSQINPHFLYNTLDNINYMIKNEEKNKSVTMINSLSDLFRYGLSRKEILITIEEEIKYARAYTEIMNNRYNDQIEYIWEIDESLLTKKVIKLILQPIIENAIYHGVRHNERQKRIVIKCEKSNDTIVFTIDDNGKGMTKEELEIITTKLISGDTSNNIGINNVQTRLYLYYGKNYGITINSEYNKGTVIKLRIPIKT